MTYYAQSRTLARCRFCGSDRGFFEVGVVEFTKTWHVCREGDSLSIEPGETESIDQDQSFFLCRECAAETAELEELIAPERTVSPSG